jgi:hypothetical protein
MRKKRKTYRVRKDTSVKRKNVKKAKPAIKEKQPTIYRGIPCDSEAEELCLSWLFELAAEGYVSHIERADSYLLFDTVTRNWVERLKTKSKSHLEIVHNACSYTPDFKCFLTTKGLNCKLFKDISGNERLFERGKFFLIHQNGVVHIEVKGTKFRNENSTEEKWSVVKKWLWEKHHVYINLWTHDTAFPLTWTPSEYLVTKVKRQPRVIHWKKLNIHEYLNTT